MASVIKHSAPGHQTQTVAFQFADMSEKAKKYLESVQAEANRIIVDAQQQAEAIRQRAQQEGRAAGMAEIDQIAEQKVAAHAKSLMPALEKVIAQIEQARQAWIKHWEQQAIHLAAAMAARIARREVQRQPEITLDLLREALELSAGAATVRVFLNPADQQSLGEQAQILIEQFGPRDRIEVVPDTKITAGGCRVETQFSVIDQQFEAQLARIEQELN